MSETKVKLWTKNFYLLIVMLFANSFCFQMLNSTLALYVESIVGADSGISGTISGAASLIFTIAILVARLVAGDMIERFGRRPVITTGAAILGIGCLLNAFIPTVAALLVLRAIQGFGAGSCSTGTSVSVVQVVPQERLSEGVGKSSMGGTASMIVGPGIALALIAGGNFKIPFFVVGISTSVVILCCWNIHTKHDEMVAERRRRKEQPAVAATTEKKETNILWRLVERSVIWPAIIQGLVMISFASYTTFLTIYAERRGFTHAGYFFAISSVVMVITQFTTGKLGDKYGPVEIAIPGMCSAILAFIGVALVPNEILFLACGVFYGIGSGLIMPVLNATTIKGVSEDRKSAATATFYTLYDGGLGIGALLWGVVVDVVGIQAMYFGAACTMALAAVFTFYVFRIRNWPNTPKKAKG